MQENSGKCWNGISGPLHVHFKIFWGGGACSQTPLLLSTRPLISYARKLEIFETALLIDISYTEITTLTVNLTYLLHVN